MNEVNAVKDESERNEVERLQPVVINQSRQTTVCRYCNQPDSGWIEKDLKRGKRTHPSGCGIEYHCYSAYCD